MSEPRPELRLVDTSTGEIVHQDERDILIDQLEREKRGMSLQIGKLRKEVAELRLVEPEAQTIQEVLEYCRERFAKPRQHITPGGERWEKCRARLRDRLDGRGPWSPAELKLAADGALLDPWISGAAPRAPKDGRFLDAKTIFKSPEKVEELRDLALGFVAQTGTHLRDILDITDELRVVSWRHILKVCECGCRRIEHHKADRAGQEGCLICACPDFYEDRCHRFNEWGDA